MSKTKFYVTTPIYYVNSKPHLGTLYSTLLADVIARWQKLQGRETFFLTGLDEHGQKVEQAAINANLDPQAFVDGMAPDFHKVWSLYNLQYDGFIRTTQSRHRQAVIKLFEQLIAQGDIYKGAYQGFYCVPCETFVNLQPEAGEQTPLCSSCQRLTVIVEEESYFFRLSKYQDVLLDFYEKNPNFINPSSRLNEVISFVKGGLKDLSISRKSVKWGIPFPGDPSHTIYVWGDALTNYISAVGYGDSSAEGQKLFDSCWPADVHVMAKDIVRFHAVYWPAFLLAADLPLPHKLLVHGYILVNAQKMSKSLGNGVDPIELAERYGVDQVRYYLLRHMATSQDGNFDLHELEQSINADLANNLGNLAQRAVALAYKYQLSNLSLPEELLQAENRQLLEACRQELRLYQQRMNEHQFHLALAGIWKLLTQLNGYFHATQPWVMAKEQPDQLGEFLYAIFHCLHQVGMALWPIMPSKSQQLAAMLGQEYCPGRIDFDGMINSSIYPTFKFTLPLIQGTITPLFAKIISMKEADSVMEEVIKQDSTEKNDVQQILKAETKLEYIDFEDFAKVKIAVGQIKTCVAVAGSTKLYRLEVDFGGFGLRQVVSGIAEHFQPEDLLERKAAFVINLKPRKIMGLESQAMILAAKDGSHFTLTNFINSQIAVGTLLS